MAFILDLFQLEVADVLLDALLADVENLELVGHGDLVSLLGRFEDDGVQNVLLVYEFVQLLVDVVNNRVRQQSFTRRSQIQILLT